MIALVDNGLFSKGSIVLQAVELVCFLVMGGVRVLWELISNSGGGSVMGIYLHKRHC